MEGILELFLKLKSVSGQLLSVNSDSVNSHSQSIQFEKIFTPFFQCI